jgi:hypothetical protein
MAFEAILAEANLALAMFPRSNWVRVKIKRSSLT